jgi:molybdopterin molybdotransferase
MNQSTPTLPGCDELASGSLSVDAARQRILDSVVAVCGEEQVFIRDALNRTLSRDITSSINVPPYTNSAMDGYAIQASDIPTDGDVRLTVVGKAFAGEPYQGNVGQGECIRIMTGAKMPQGADTVIMQEHVERDGDTITLSSGHKPQQNVRYAGEDLSPGETVFRKGKRLTPADIGMLASMGEAEVHVFRRVRVAFFSTGDELRSLGQALGDGQIYDSNRYTLFGMLSQLHMELLDMGVIPDDRQKIEQAFHSAAQVADVIITSGGVSVGEADYVKETLEKLGEVKFWKIAMKPGRPLAFGNIGKCRFFGLPGNPVSAMVTFYQFVQPALLKMAGQSYIPPLLLQAICQSSLRKGAGRAEFQRGKLETDNEGRLVVSSTGAQGSGLLSSMSHANCFILLEAEAKGVEAGAMVQVQPFAGLINP